MKPNKKPLVIAVANQKGGVGKSTTAAAIGAAMHTKGAAVLLVDLDGQCNLTSTLLDATPALTAYEVLTGSTHITNAIYATADAGDILPASELLQGSDKVLTKVDALAKALSALGKRYDVIVIDTPPALGMLTVNAFTAADKVIVPAGADAYSLKGLQALNETVQAVKRHSNPDITIEGVLLTRFSARSILSRDLAEAIADTAAAIGSKVFNAKIRDAIAVKEAQAMRQSLYSYAPNSKPAQDYLSLIDEIL